MGSSPFSKSSCPTYDKEVWQLQSAGYIDSTDNLVAAYDAATAHLGAPWRMPTDADFADLVSMCDTTWETCNGVWGLRVKGKGAYASKSVFLPAAGDGSDSYDGYDILGQLGSRGHYWSSTQLWFLDFSYSDDISNQSYNDTYSELGFPVRPVRDSAQ